MRFEQCRPRVGRTTALLLVPMAKALSAWGLDGDVDSGSVSVSQTQH